MEAACALIPDTGIHGLSHRLVAARAGVPLGATTYYFTDLADLSRAALEHAAARWTEELRAWATALRDSDDVPAALAALAARYAEDRPRALIEAELYTAAARRPELRPLAHLWFDGLVRVLRAHTTPAAATATALLLDGALLRALRDEDPVDVTELTAALRTLMGDGPEVSGRR